MHNRDITLMNIHLLRQSSIKLGPLSASEVISRITVQNLRSLTAVFNNPLIVLDQSVDFGIRIGMNQNS